MSTSKASLHDLPGIGWNAQAALNDSMSRTNINTELVAVWFDENGMLRWSHSCKSTAMMVLLLEAAKIEALYGRA